MGGFNLFSVLPLTGYIYHRPYLTQLLDMKRPVFVVALIYATVLHCAAQKVDLDKFNFTFEFRDLPLKPLSPELRSYAVTLQTPDIVRSTFPNGALEEMVTIDGWKKVSPLLSQVLVEVKVTDVSVTAAKVLERVEILRDASGNETGKKNMYRMEIQYTFECAASLKDFKDMPISNVSIGSGNYSWETKEYGTSKEANDFYNNNRQNIMTELRTTKVKEGLGGLTATLNTNYGFPTRKEAQNLWILDSKKHPETTAQKEAWEKFKAAAATVTADQMSDDAKAKFTEVIQYFDGIATRFAADEKADKKMRYGSYYNKARIYLYLDNPQAAMKEADALIANGYDEDDGKKIRKEAEELAEKLRLNKTGSRHFTMDKLSAVATGGVPAKSQRFRVEKITETRNSESMPAVVYDKKFDYTDGALTTITITQDSKPDDVIGYVYGANDVVAKSQRIKRIENLWSHDNGLLKTYVVNYLNTLHFDNNGGRLSMMTHEDKCDKLINYYNFVYDDKGRVATVKTSRKDQGPKILGLHKVTYDDKGRVAKVDELDGEGKSVVRSFTLERAGEKVAKVNVTFQGQDPEARYEFDYDSNGNIIEQRVFRFQNKKEFKTHTYAITYAEAKGNDSVMWDSNNWIFNNLLGMRSYHDLDHPCY
jgi:hypothetical protein